MPFLENADVMQLLSINSVATPLNFEISKSYPIEGQNLNDSAPQIVKEHFEI